jgi:general secretion pathway protein A
MCPQGREKHPSFEIREAIMNASSQEGSAPGSGRVATMNPDRKPAHGKGGNLLSFFGLRRNTFNISPDPRDLFWTPQARRAVSELTAAVAAGKGLIVLTGEVGTGKTTLINHLLDSLRARSLPVAFVFNSHLNVDNLYDFILADFGVKEDPSRPRNMRKVLHDWLYARHRSGQRPIVIVDEAQGLSFEVLEELRMLLNLEIEGEKLIQIILSGQPELDATLAKPQMLQLRQRISLRCKTAGLTFAETHDYIECRLQSAGAEPDSVFAHEALDAIYFYSGGTPRVVNLLCEQALLHAFAQRISPISTGVVEAVAREFQFDDFKPFPRSLDLSPRTIADVLPMPTSPTKMRLAAMAARELVSAGVPQAQLEAPSLNPVTKPTPRPAPPAAVPSTTASPEVVTAPVPTRFQPRRYIPVSVRIRAALRRALLAAEWGLAASSRWLRQPMGPPHARRG